MEKELFTGEMTAAAGQNEEKRLSWEEILSDPEYRASYDAAVQEIVRRRLRKSRGAEDCLVRLHPLFEALAERYGLSAEPYELDAELAAGMILEGLRENQMESEMLLRHLEKLFEQEGAMRERFPGFELMAALEDPMFLKLTAPHNNLSLADAYYALHREEIGREAVRESMEAISRSLRSGGLRPRELRGSGEAGAFSPDPRSMSKAEREQLKKRIYAAGALRQKIYP